MLILRTNLAWIIFIFYRRGIYYLTIKGMCAHLPGWVHCKTTDSCNRYDPECCRLSDILLIHSILQQSHDRLVVCFAHHVLTMGFHCPLTDKQGIGDHCIAVFLGY